MENGLNIEKAYFKECFHWYLYFPEYREEINKKYPLIKEGIEKIGVKRCKQLLYVQKKIRAAIDNLDAYNEQQDDIDAAMREDFKVGEFYPCQYAKIKIQQIYKEFYYKKKAKGSDLTRVFKVKRANKYHKGRATSGYLILDYT